MLSLVNCLRSIEKKPGSLVAIIVALFFAEHRSATNSPIISSRLLSLNPLTLNYIGLLVLFSVSSINITWMLENALFISQFCISSSSSRAVFYNKSIH